MDNKIFSKTVSLYSLAKWTNGLAYKDFHFSTTGVPIIKIAELKNGITSQTQFTNDIFDESVKLNYDDLLFSWSGNPDTSIDVFRYRRNDGWLNQHIFKVVPNGVSKDYLFYLLKSLQPTFAFIASNKQTTGLGHVTIADLKRLNVYVHSLKEQQHIVDILGSIDNSIEKSEQIISEIERLIHLQFSVFYGGLTTKSTIGKEFECCLGGTPKTTCPEYWDGNINWINSGEVNKLRICNASKKISQLGMEKSATKLLNRGTTVIAITGATLGQVSLLEIDTCANQSVIGIGENQIKKDFIYPLIMHHISDLIKKQTGGAQQHINMNDVKSLEIMVPTLTQYRDYSFEVMPLFDLQSSLCVKIEKMKELKALYLKKFFG